MNSLLTRPWRLLVIALVLLNGLFPFVWILLTSFKTEAELSQSPIQWLPSSWSLSNYQQAFTEQPLLLFISNSLGIALFSAVLTVALTASAAYALVRLPLPHKGLWLVLLVTLAMCPPATLQVPLFDLFRSLGLLNSWLALVLTNAVLSLPVCLLVFIGYFQSLPVQLEQAALLDGCNRWQVLRHIVLPLSKPAVYTAATLAFVNAWDEFLFALVLNAAPHNRTLPVGILLYQGEYSFPWPLISAALVVGILPLLLLIALSQQRLVGNTTAGGIKG